jgi:hypothetical protein
LKEEASMSVSMKTLATATAMTCSSFGAYAQTAMPVSGPNPLYEGRSVAVEQGVTPEGCIRASNGEMSPCDPVYFKRADGRLGGQDVVNY